LSGDQPEPSPSFGADSGITGTSTLKGFIFGDAAEEDAVAELWSSCGGPNAFYCRQHLWISGHDLGQFCLKSSIRRTH
jgi:hypothetical protein